MKHECINSMLDVIVTMMDYNELNLDVNSADHMCLSHNSDIACRESERETKELEKTKSDLKASLRKTMEYCELIKK